MHLIVVLPIAPRAAAEQCMRQKVFSYRDALKNRQKLSAYSDDCRERQQSPIYQGHLEDRLNTCGYGRRAFPAIGFDCATQFMCEAYQCLYSVVYSDVSYLNLTFVAPAQPLWRRVAVTVSVEAKEC